MNKLIALLPLLGWFYIAIAVFTLLRWIVRKRFSKISRLYYLGFGSVAFFLMLFSMIDEISLFSLSNKTMHTSFEQKMSEESSDYYKDYYLTLRPALTHEDVVYMPNIDTRELLYVRAFLYPAQVESAPLPLDETLTIVGKDQLKEYPREFEVVAETPNRSLIRVKGEE